MGELMQKNNSTENVKEKAENGVDIVLKQAPVISHQLAKVGKSVTERISSLGIDNMVASEDTVKSLKNLKSELNKEFTFYENQRKQLKNAIATPYVEFETIYKTEISDKYNIASEKLKDKIAEVETKVKTEKKTKIENFFNELCLSEKIDFLAFDNVGLTINLSTSEKAYKDKCIEFVDRVKDDIALIETQEHKVEIFADYKITLSASKSISTVLNRKEREAREVIRLKNIENNRRAKLLQNIGVTLSRETETYHYDDDIYMSKSKIEDCTNDEFNKYLLELSENVKLKKANLKPTLQAPNTVKKEVQKPTKTEAEAKSEIPTKEEPEQKLEILTTKFQVDGTLPQIKALANYMRENNLTFKSIK